ncbi:hypothetical protein IV203_021536 [Nitzschia inconspicua]|uniref:protein-serine/threonine phosphatase n=1 Tax=Nitzschia inconspicua TaxID=303405 RepID=A0A9K3KHZ9_9STRA|nr:hypothetical protein IV203_021536 [Nitzschia inconspicua]
MNGAGTIRGIHPSQCRKVTPTTVLSNTFTAICFAVMFMTFARGTKRDLGQHVKSLKRIFPCGGAMAAVVDDREDVWANADDNSDSTIKGEPPENLLLVRPYHWQPFVGFADINNAAGSDLSESKQGNDNNTNNKDPYNEQDQQ